MHTLKKQIDMAWAVYQQKIDRIADHTWATKVNPYFKKYNIVFLNGNGTYFLSCNGTSIESESLPKWLRDILDCEIPGMEADSLGTVMNPKR